MPKLPLKNKAYLMAERMGFEPMKELLLYTLSKRAPSTARPPLQIKFFFKYNFLYKLLSKFSKKIYKSNYKFFCKSFINNDNYFRK